MDPEPDGVVHPKKRAFLAAYAECGNITAACAAAGVGRQTYYDWSERDERFVLEARQAYLEAGDRLEEHARKWATLGTPTTKEIYEDGALVRREESRDINATLLIFLLKGAKPEKYRERLDVQTSEKSVKAIADGAWESV